MQRSKDMIWIIAVVPAQALVSPPSSPIYSMPDDLSRHSVNEKRKIRNVRKKRKKFQRVHSKVSPIKFTVIDPIHMHNLFLGTGKHVFKVWVEMEYFKNKTLSEIESKLRCPYDIAGFQ